MTKIMFGSFMIGSVLFAGEDIAPVKPEVITPTSVPTVSTPMTLPSGERNWLVGVKVGTLGAGLDIGTNITDKLNARVNLNGFTYNTSQTENNIKYDISLKLKSAGILLDYFPFDSFNSLRLTGGAYYNGNKINGTAKPTATTPLDINGVKYTAAEIAQLDADLSFKKFAPYIGLGLGEKAKNKGWSASFDIGELYQGTPNLDTVAIKGTLVPSTAWTQVLTNVAAEKAKINNDIKNFKWYPVVMFGVNYTF